jgi:hypothetical protein
MKTATLPICIPAIPSPDTSPEIWRQVAPILSAIAEREKRNEDLYPSERTAYNALSFAQYQAGKKQWLSLWQYLLDRQVVQIGTIATPPPKPKSDRPKNKPPKNVAKPEVKRKRNINRERKTDRKSPTYLYVFACLKPCLSGLHFMLNLYSFFAYIAPLCPRIKPPLRDRPDGQRIKALLAYKTADGEYSSLKVYMPSLKRRYKMNPDVQKLLLDWSNPQRLKTRKKIESDKAKGLAKRIITTAQINSVLTDKWQDAVTIAAKLNELLGENIEFKKISKLLYNRSVAGEIYRFNRDHHEISYFSRVQATEFESEWMTLEMAYQLAVSRGCPFARNTFRKTHKFDYSAYGLEFRKAAPDNECSLLRYRDIQL